MNKSIKERLYVYEIDMFDEFTALVSVATPEMVNIR